jgi:hypothetical protein
MPTGTEGDKISDPTADWSNPPPSVGNPVISWMAAPTTLSASQGLPTAQIRMFRGSTVRVRWRAIFFTTAVFSRSPFLRPIIIPSLRALHFLLHLIGRCS